MKRILILAVAAVAAAAPAAGGLLGNQSFASSVPVRSAAAGPAAVSWSVTPVAAAPVGTVKAKHGSDDPPGDDKGKHKGGGKDDKGNDDHGKAKHNDDPAGDNHGRAKHGADDPAGDDNGGRRGGHGADDAIVSATSATIVPMSAKSTTRQAEKGDDHGRGHGSDDKGTDDKGKRGGHDDGPRHT